MKNSAETQPVVDFIGEYEVKGVSFSQEGMQLRISAPKGALNSTDAEKIRARKADILQFLQSRFDYNAPIPHLSVPEQSTALGYAQQQMWFHQQMFPDSPLYQLPFAWRVSGEIDVRRLSAALNKVVSRHGVLRSRISVSDGIPSVSYDTARIVELVADEITPEDASTITSVIGAWIEPHRKLRLDIENGELFRIKLLSMSREDHVLFFMPHHIIWDGLSTDIFIRELSAFYDNQLAAIDAPKLRYSDFTEWQTDWMESADFESEVRYWGEKINDGESSLSIPVEKKRPMLFTYEGDAVCRRVGFEFVERLTSFSKAKKCTNAQVLLSAWLAFLYRISGQSKISVGMPTSGREKDQLGDLTGLFSNVVVVSEEISGQEQFSDFLDKVRDRSLEAFSHQRVPMEYLLQRHNNSSDPSLPAIFQSMFTHQDVRGRKQSIGGAALESITLRPTYCLVDLHLGVGEGTDAMEIEISYNPSLFSAEMVANFCRYFNCFLDAALKNPASQICDLPLSQQMSLETKISAWNDTVREYRRALLTHHRFEIEATAEPSKTAIRMEGKSTSYAELNERAEEIAACLRMRNIGENAIVGIYLHRSMDVVAAMLGVWKVGAAFLPLDPMFPKSRLAYMVSDSGAACVVSASSLKSSWPIDEASVIDLENLSCEATGSERDVSANIDQKPNSRAYVIYTSGSTGNPKGVEVSHLSLTNFLEAMAQTPGLSRGDNLLAVTTVSFDVMLLELFLPLSVGAKVVMASDDEAMDGARLSEVIDHEDITVLQGTPATWRILFDAGWKGKSTLKCLCGGEPLPEVLAETLVSCVGELWNMYGPTETTVWSSCARIIDGNNIHVGRPIANTSFYIRDAEGRLVPPGLPGDLWIGGDGVALGYLGRDALTQEKFHVNAFNDNFNGRIYNTGDRAKWRLDGNVEIIGRQDNQVKIRGYRIELGDIEASLGRFDGVKECAAAVLDDPTGEPSLAAYVVFHNGEAATGSELRRWMKKTLPQYMVPQFYTVLNELPLTANNKVDRKRLPPPAGAARAGARFIPPQTDTESEIAKIWSEILNINDISVTDNFFELGGQSLQVARMVARVRAQLSLAISPRSVIFETLEQLSTGAIAIESA